MRTLPDGSIVFPTRGNPPCNPDESKYERDSGDPFHFRLRLKPCNQRITVDKIIPRCRKRIFVQQCALDKEIVDYVTCELCIVMEAVRMGPRQE